MTNKQWHGSALWGKVNHFPGHSVHFPLENIDSTAIFAVFSGKVNHFSANQWHFPPNMRLSASAYICLRQKHCSRLGNASPTACITCSARCIRESKASRLLRTKHANANEFALLSASAYICQIFNSHWNEIRENSLLQGFGGKGRKDIHCTRKDRDTHFHACRYSRVRKRHLSPGSQR